MKAIDRGTVRDLGGLFVNGGYMITSNPCVDEGAEELCEDIVKLAASIPHDGVIVVERMQQRGEALIDRPHVHWIMSKNKNEVERIADELRAKGLDVKITPVWGVDGLCYYLGKDPNAKCYLMKEEYHTGGGTPPIALEEREASVPAQEKEERPISTIPMNATPSMAGITAPWSHLKETKPATMTFRPIRMPIARPVMVGMTRAP